MGFNQEGFMLLAIFLYLMAILAVGYPYFGRDRMLPDYLLGARSLRGGQAALSFLAQNMSGWLFLALPGAVYYYGAIRSALGVGLLLGALAAWLLIAPRLRQDSLAQGDALTLPQYFYNRYGSRMLRTLCAGLTLLFLSIFAGAGFSAMAKVFSSAFSLSYEISLLVAVAVPLLFAALSGFSAQVRLDSVQGSLGLAALVFVALVVSLAVLPQADGGQVLREANSGQPLGAPAAVQLLSDLSWGLGYLGMPTLLIRFLALRSSNQVRQGAAAGGALTALSLLCAVAIGLFGRGVVGELQDPLAAETVYIQLAMDEGLHPFVSGLLLCGLLAALLSAITGQLLTVGGSAAWDLVAPLWRQADDRTLRWCSRGAMALAAVLGYAVARDPARSVMDLVGLAWAGCGAAFGPVLLLGLLGKKIAPRSAVLSVGVGAAVALVWNLIPALADHFYAMLPAVLAAGACALLAGRRAQQGNGGVQGEEAPRMPERDTTSAVQPQPPMEAAAEMVPSVPAPQPEPGTAADLAPGDQPEEAEQQAERPANPAASEPDGSVQPVDTKKPATQPEALSEIDGKPLENKQP